MADPVREVLDARREAEECRRLIDRLDGLLEGYNARIREMGAKSLDDLERMLARQSKETDAREAEVVRCLEDEEKLIDERG